MRSFPLWLVTFAVVRSFNSAIGPSISNRQRLVSAIALRSRTSLLGASSRLGAAVRYWARVVDVACPGLSWQGRSLRWGLLRCGRLSEHCALEGNPGSV